MVRHRIVEFAFLAVEADIRLHSQELYPWGIDGNGKGKGIILIRLAMGPAGETEEFIGARRGADVDLGPPNDNTILLTIHDPQIKVLVLFLL